MGDLKYFAERLVSLDTTEVEELAKLLKEEFGIEPAGQKVDIQENGKAPISRQDVVNLSERLKRNKNADKNSRFFCFKFACFFISLPLHFE